MIIIQKILNHTGVRRYAFNTSWLLLEHLLRLLSGVLVGAWVARYLGPNDFGLFSYSIAFFSIFQGVAGLGLDNVVVKKIIEKSHDVDNYLGSAFWLKLVMSVLTFFCVMFMSFLINDHTTTTYILILAFGLIFQSFDVVDSFYKANVRAKYISICKIFQLIISSTLKIILIFNGCSLKSFVFVSMVDSLTFALTLFLGFHFQTKRRILNKFSFTAALELLTESWPLMLSSLAVMISMRIDQVMIKFMLGENDVGIYSASTRLAEVWYFLPVLVSTSFFPAIINSKKNQAIYLDRLCRLLTVASVISVFISLMVCFFRSEMIFWLYGDDFVGAESILLVQTWTLIFVSLGVISGQWYIVENLPWFAFMRTFCGAILNIVLNLFLIPKYGALGAAYATLVSQSFAGLFFDFMSKDTRLIFKLKIEALALWRVRRWLKF